MKAKGMAEAKRRAEVDREQRKAEQNAGTGPPPIPTLGEHILRS